MPVFCKYNLVQSLGLGLGRVDLCKRFDPILDLVVLFFLNAVFVLKAGFCLVFLVESNFALACYHEHQVIAFMCSKYWGLCAASGFTD